MKEEINLLQAMMDGMSRSWMEQRAKTQMTLCSLIEQLSKLDKNRLIEGLDNPHSYRGYYSDLSFEREIPIDKRCKNVKKVLKMLKECMGKVFEGYKGGDFVMGANTPLWRAGYGDCGVRIMSLDLSKEVIILITAPEEEN